MNVCKFLDVKRQSGDSLTPGTPGGVSESQASPRYNSSVIASFELEYSILSFYRFIFKEVKC